MENKIMAPASSLKRMLESVVRLNWAEVMPQTPGGLIDVEYRFSADGTLEYLRLWACSKRGFWNLVCQYSMYWRWSQSQDVSFGTGYASRQMGESLGYILQHQSRFASDVGAANKLVQVHEPSVEQSKAAQQFVAGASVVA